MICLPMIGIWTCRLIVRSEFSVSKRRSGLSVVKLFPWLVVACARLWACVFGNLWLSDPGMWAGFYDLFPLLPGCGLVFNW